MLGVRVGACSHGAVGSALSLPVPQALGPMHPETVASTIDLAMCVSTQGRYKEAEPLYQAALAARQQVRPVHAVPFFACSLQCARWRRGGLLAFACITGAACMGARATAHGRTPCGTHASAGGHACCPADVRAGPP